VAKRSLIVAFKKPLLNSLVGQITSYEPKSHFDFGPAGHIFCKCVVVLFITFLKILSEITNRFLIGDSCMYLFSSIITFSGVNTAYIIIGIG